jgi:membrane-bound serine protease (ClpP class)
MRRTLSWLSVALFALLAVLPVFAASPAHAAGAKVYVLKIDNQQVIDQGLALLTRRVFMEAEADPGAVAVALIIDTPGGYTDAAIRMKETILNSRLRSVAYVTNMAASSGALIATASEKLYMHPGSTIGSAEVRYAGTDQAADYKTMSEWIGQFRSAAEARGRDPVLAQAMVDKNRKIPGQTAELLSLTSADAVAKGYANGLADTLSDALSKAGITGYDLVEIQATPADQVARLLTTPWVAILLLVVGVVAIGIEFMKPGVTLPGLIGVISLGLFFLGNVLAGTAGLLELGLAFLGILLLLIEAFIPGFGLFGFGGVACMVASVFLSVDSPRLAMQYLMWTSIAFMLALFGIIRGLSRRGLGKVLTLKKDERGFLPARADLSHITGLQGQALTTLRPAGTAQFGEEKVDVVTEGEFVKAGTTVKVIRVDGARVTVRPVE